MRVIATPGHTLGHIAYWMPGAGVAFVGDTLFAIGCGRVIEGTPEMMWESLSKLAALPDETVIYCGHEYTEANARFALTIEPGNADLVEAGRRSEPPPRRRQADLADNHRPREEDQSRSSAPTSRRCAPPSGCPTLLRPRSSPR